MAHDKLPFQYQAEKNDSGLTGFAGLPLYIELAIKSGLINQIKETLQVKQQGWSDAELILSLIVLNIAGGDCISDIDRLEADTGFRSLLVQFATHGMKRKERRAYEKKWRKTKERGLPSRSAFHQYLPIFHSPKEESKREEGKAFIPLSNEYLKSLCVLNTPLVAAAQKHSPSTTATLDQDATLSATQKSKAFYCYKGFKAYQPFNTYWSEHGMVLHSEFRDGNVNAGFEQLRVLKEAIELLPNGVNKIYLRSDSAGYQEELIRYCADGNNPRFGVIEFAIAAKVSAGIKKAALELSDSDWKTIYTEDDKGNKIATNQEWADICFVPDWAVKSKAEYRYIAIREAMKSTPQDDTDVELPFQTVKSNNQNYKLFAVVTNRDIDGGELIQWHRKRCGKSEQLHSTQKEGLAGGQFPSNLFGVNAAWWQIVVIAFNLNRLMQIVAMPKKLKESKMKSLRFHFIQVPGRIVRHARQLFLCVENKFQNLLALIREKIGSIDLGTDNSEFNTS